MENLINPNLDPASYREEFIKNGSVFIRDFLKPEYAEKMHYFLNVGMPEDWWYSVSCPGSQGFIDYIRNFPESKERINVEKSHAYSVMNAGGFSYHFYRSAGDHVHGCYCDGCHFDKWLKSKELLDFIGAVSGQTYKGYDTVFASRYSEGCFLSPHHDQNLGDIGFVYQLTKGWRPQWGGLLHFLDDTQSQVELTEIPTFNTLTLFYLPENKGKWHYVSHVNAGVTHHRYAYSGWYRK